MFSGGETYNWIYKFDDIRMKFASFRSAKEDLLDHLWWEAREYIDAEPEYYEDIMTGWVTVAGWSSDFGVYSFELKVRDTTYILVRYDREVDKAAQ